MCGVRATRPVLRAWVRRSYGTIQRPAPLELPLQKYNIALCDRSRFLCCALAHGSVLAGEAFRY